MRLEMAQFHARSLHFISKNLLLRIITLNPQVSYLSGHQIIFYFSCCKKHL
ncbi:protein of unknown function [Shewanella benthica]|uniref:Uncharacterized protein n=1 Tax=Shewanella benthica TaxID=43661 RepID=A0A330M3U7_9GAMM|nr:protein of unknown function [Shewanella benthica]